MAVPSTPSAAPFIHKRAPDGRTKVGLFWPDIDPATGRTNAAHTWGVKRCSGAACTPSTVIASGLTDPDYQDNGLTANTVYRYTYFRTNGDGNSGDSPVAEITTKPTNDNIVDIPGGAAIANLLGPLPEEANVPFQNYIDWAKDTGTLAIAKIPRVFPNTLSGTGAINNGSAIVTGTGTHFLEQVYPNTEDGGNFGYFSIGGVLKQVLSVQSNTQLTLTTNWSTSNVSGQALTTNTSPTQGDLWSYMMGNGVGYYDAGLALFQIYLMTGDPQYLRGWIKFADGEFAHHHLGRDRGVINLYTSPRQAALCSLILRAYFGRPEMWDYLDEYTQEKFDGFVIGHYGDTYVYSPRDTGYTIQFAVWLLALLPDSFPRSDGSTTSANGTITVDGTLATGAKKYYKDNLEEALTDYIEVKQAPDGAFWFVEGLGGNYAYLDWTRGPDGEIGTGHYAQPFTAGLLGDALGHAWRNTSLSSTARNSARRCVLRYANYIIHEAFNRNVMADDPPNRLRFAWYYHGGGSGGDSLNPYDYSFGGASAFIGTGNYANARQANNEVIMGVGWALEITGNEEYRTAAEDILNASFASIGENVGPTDGDGYACLAYNPTKEFTQGYRGTMPVFQKILNSYSPFATPPTITMPSNQTLTDGVNQAVLTATLDSDPNGGCTYMWTLEEYDSVETTMQPQPAFYPNNALTTKLCSLGPNGTYKARLFVTDALGLTASGTVTIITGDGEFPPVIAMYDQSSQTTFGTAAAGSVTMVVDAYSPSGRTITTTVTVERKPKDKSNPSIGSFTPSANHFTCAITGIQDGYFQLKVRCVDSAGSATDAYFEIKNPDSPDVAPVFAHSTAPNIIPGPNQILPAGSTSTKLVFVDANPEGWFGVDSPATGYWQSSSFPYRYLVMPRTYLTVFTSGPATPTITYPDRQQPEITGMTAAGTYTFTTTATNGQGDVDSVVVTVTTEGSEANSSPTCNAGSDQTLPAGTTSTTLTGTANDPDGDPLDITWTLDSGPNVPSIVDDDQLETDVTGMIAGTYIFLLTVDDGINSPVSNSVQVTILEEGLGSVEICRWHDGCASIFS